MLRPLYEDAYLWILDKPAGLHSVTLEDSDRSLAALMLDAYPDLANVSERAGDAGLVNRLDQDTSGVIVGAKTSEVWTSLRSAIQSGDLFKTYLAIVDGTINSETKIFNHIGSPYRRASKVRVYEKPPQKPHRALEATTIFRPTNVNRTAGVTLLSAEAPTARRHQIRAHSAFIGHPLVGDKLYGSKRTLGELGIAFETSRDFFLHADRCTFVHPISGNKIDVECPITAEVASFFAGSNS